MTYFKKIICMLLCVFSIHHANPPFVHHSREGAGFFAEVHSVVYYLILILFNDPLGREFDVQWTEEFFPYKNGLNENGWNTFFKPIGYVQKTRDIHGLEIIHDQNCLDKWLNYDAFLNYRVGINKILNRYIHIHQKIIDEVEDYYNTHMTNELIIGVHVRFSAAHSAEKPASVGLSDYFNEIDALIKKLKKPYKIYLATDSNFVVQKFKKRYKDKLLYIDAIRSNYMEEVHLMYDNPAYWHSHPEEFHQRKPGYKGGKDALMDCLLLSKCEYLIHTTSNVSSFATYYNPHLKSIFVPKHIPKKEYICPVCASTNKWYEKDF